MAKKTLYLATQKSCSFMAFVDNNKNPQYTQAFSFLYLMSADTFCYVFVLKSKKVLRFNTKTTNNIIQLINGSWWPLQEVHQRARVQCANTLPRILLCFSAFNQPEWRAVPVSHRKGEFPERSRLFQQTKHWLIALLFVGSVPVFVLHFSFV